MSNLIYVFPGTTGECSIVWNSTTLTEENKTRGIALESLPVEETPEGKYAQLMGDKETGKVWWDYRDIPQ